MKCARIHLHERSKGRAGWARRAAGRPRRLCQRRLVEPQPAEDPRWAGLLDSHAGPPHPTGSDRFNYNADEDTLDHLDNTHEDLFLSVQNLKFDGDVEVRKRPKTCFKYKALSDGKKHRMFVKQIVEEEENNTDDCSSQLTCCYFDDYVKYILNSDQPDPASEKSSLLFFSHDNKLKEHTVEHLEIRKQASDLRNGHKNNHKVKNIFVSTKELTETAVGEPSDLTSENTRVIYHKSGKRKCLTISRAQSPETVQVIRVDVVRARGAGAPAAAPPDASTHNDKTSSHNIANTGHSKIINNINMKTSHFSNKYLLTNTIKPLDENVSGGAKVTLLCKTFRLSRRNTSKPVSKNYEMKKINDEIN